MMRIICFVLISTGGILMFITALKYDKMFEKMKSGSDYLPDYPPAIKNILRSMFVFFIIGFIVGAADILMTKEVKPIFYFIGIVFFVASLCAFLIVRHLSLMAQALSEKNIQLQKALKHIEIQNIRLQSEVEARVVKIIEQDKLLHTVNEMASILLASNVGEFGVTLNKCMGMLAEGVSVDRTYIWENSWKDGKLYCTQLSEWSGGADPQQGNELTVNVPFPEDWYDRLSDNRCVNGIASEFPAYEREHLQAQGIVSILVVPVFINNRFWGFVGFDDCHNERNFSEGEEGILRSASLLIATSMQRNEMMQKLMLAREEALSSAKAKSIFLSNMSHEIRTPINAITGMTAIARMSQDSAGCGETVEDCLNKIDAASYQLLGIISDILDMSKIDAGKMELAHQPFNLHAMLQNVKSIIGIRAEEKRQNFSLNIDAGVPKAVIGDDVRLSQIFINLLSNAVKFTPEAGEITLDIRMALQKDDGFIFEARVRDSGIGISAEHQKRLFRAFQQADRNISRNYGGTGLGLAISKNIAILMGGDISVRSAENEGSCFTVNFRLQGGTEEMLESKASNKDLLESDFSKYTALLAEDIVINREIVLAMLKPAKIAIEYAENGEEALKMFSANPDKYDMIFMDIQMPVMDGYKATRAIRALETDKAKRIPIIAMTANAYKEDVERAIESGMNEHISKPIDFNAVIKVLKKYLK